MIADDVDLAVDTYADVIGIIFRLEDNANQLSSQLIFLR
jgi:hypothetical protein